MYYYVVLSYTLHHDSQLACIYNPIDVMMRVQNLAHRTVVVVCHSVYIRMVT